MMTGTLQTEDSQVVNDVKQKSSGHRNNKLIKSRVINASGVLSLYVPNMTNQNVQRICLVQQMYTLYLKLTQLLYMKQPLMQEAFILLFTVFLDLLIHHFILFGLIYVFSVALSTHYCERKVLAYCCNATFQFSVNFDQLFYYVSF